MSRLIRNESVKKSGKRKKEIKRVKNMHPKMNSYTINQFSTIFFMTKYVKFYGCSELRKELVSK